jgi:hypothetical protein
MENILFLRPTIPFEARGKAMYIAASKSQPVHAFALSFEFFTNSVLKNFLTYTQLSSQFQLFLGFQSTKSPFPRVRLEPLFSNSF